MVFTVHSLHQNIPSNGECEVDWRTVDTIIFLWDVYFFKAIIFGNADLWL